ncbi:MAG: ABC transporter ATP-binding protein [Chitinispirillaceae bacterium]|nr:ABC transporter ATP-binding protein [Chitinispirillaceae bacterium]
MNPVLEFTSVSVRYPGSIADTVSDLSFHVHPDERVALFGLNGSGKTTLLLAAAGLVPFSGAIRIDGIPVEKKTMQKARDRIGFLFNVPEDQILFPRVLDDVAYGLIRGGTSWKQAREKSRAKLTALGAADLADRSPFQLSHGQRQRIALAGALVSDPAVLLLDEPTSGLDPLGKRSLSDLLRSVNASILIATHDVGFASRTCGRFLVLSESRLREFPDCISAERCLLGDVSAQSLSGIPH